MKVSKEDLIANQWNQINTGTAIYMRGDYNVWLNTTFYPNRWAGKVEIPPQIIFKNYYL